MTGVVARLTTVDEALASRLNAAAHASPAARQLTAWAAVGLAGVEALLVGALAVAGRRESAARMLAAIGLVYLAGEALGLVWGRERPFARLSEVDALVTHSAARSFPSRHVAAGLAMAAIGSSANPRLGAGMAATAWLLGFSRVAAGLHYPSDVLGGAVLGAAIGHILESRSLRIPY